MQVERRLQQLWVVVILVFLYAAMESRQIAKASNGDSKDKLCIVSIIYVKQYVAMLALVLHTTI